uniref:Uncharacterized protein n=1 Tax=Octopus bimaculoides TaxID=37653 RepID=A0A0L8GP38_OCTBM
MTTRLIRVYQAHASEECERHSVLIPRVTAHELAGEAQLPYCQHTAWILPAYCHTTATKPPSCCQPTAILLPSYRHPTANILPSYCQHTSILLTTHRCSIEKRANIQIQCLFNGFLSASIESIIFVHTSLKIMVLFASEDVSMT